MATVLLRLPNSLAGDDVHTPARPGLWRRMYDAMVEAQMRKAQIEISRYKHLIPTDDVRLAGYRVGQTDAETLPFVR